MGKHQKTKWTCRDGTKIRICDMSDTHLANAMKYLERYAKHCQSHTIDCMYDVLSSLGGEAAQDAVESEIRNIVRDIDDGWTGLPEIYYKLQAELHKRQENKCEQSAKE